MGREVVEYILICLARDLCGQRNTNQISLCYGCSKAMGRRYPEGLGLVAWKPKLLPGEVGSVGPRFHPSHEAATGAAAGVRLPGLRCQLCYLSAL